MEVYHVVEIITDSKYGPVIRNIIATYTKEKDAEAECEWRRLTEEREYNCLSRSNGPNPYATNYSRLHMGDTRDSFRYAITKSILKTDRLTQTALEATF